MGSSYETAGGKSPTSLFRFYNQYAPSTTSNISGLIPGVAQDTLRAANEQVNPSDPSLLGLNALNLQQLERYGLPLAEIGQEIARSNALSGARTNALQLAGAGGDAARSAVALNRELNPEYYKNLQTATESATKAGDISRSINLSGLSPGEAAAIERSNNQGLTSTGNLGLTNPTNIIANAMNFGGAFNSKIPLAIQAANSASNASNAAANTATGGGGVNPISVALGQPSPTTATNFGAGQFQTTTPVSAAGPASNTFGFNQATYGTLAGNNAAAQSAGASMANATSPAAYLGAV